MPGLSNKIKEDKNQQMQTSSNFFNKSLLGLEDDNEGNKRKDRYHESHIVLDPLRVKEQLTPWTETNLMYNFHTERLVRFKEKKQKLDDISQNGEERKQIRADIVSNLFNFYKNSKQTKRSTLNFPKRKSNLKPDQNEKSCTLPQIEDKKQLEDELVYNNRPISILKIENKSDHEKHNQKKKEFGNKESINIREYLNKLKEKEKVIATFIAQKKKEGSQIDLFVSKRFIKSKSKEKINNSNYFVRQARKAQMSVRYAPIRNPQSYIGKKKSKSSQFQCLDQSFQMYKRAAQKEVHDNSGSKSKPLQSHRQIDSLLAQKSLFKSNTPLSSLFSSINVLSTIDHSHRNDSRQRKFNTISFERSFSPSNQRTPLLPKVLKKFQHK